MLSCVLGIKKYMSNNPGLNGLPYLKHKPGVRIKENSILNWCDNLDKFKEWQLYMPDPYIKKIENQIAIPDVKIRNFIAFDSNYFFSLLKSLNEK